MKSGVFAVTACLAGLFLALPCSAQAYQPDAEACARWHDPNGKWTFYSFFTAFNRHEDGRVVLPVMARGIAALDRGDRATGLALLTEAAALPYRNDAELAAVKGAAILRGLIEQCEPGPGFAPPLPPQDVRGLG